jgi:uncharacterized tellurite resistance protein B-like protein
MPNSDPAFVRDLADEKIEALVEMMYLAATADGDFSADERAQFLKSASKLTSRVLSDERLEALISTAKQKVQESGRESRLAAVKARLPDLAARKLALALAIQVSAVDGLIRTSERELIMDTANALDIDGDTAADMVKDLAAS